jgi:D-alanyl-D-alanine-carboxypeptidase/D-alanyl-D-alanine-endopeptidase
MRAVLFSVLTFGGLAPLGAQWKAPSDSALRAVVTNRVAAEMSTGMVVGVIEQGKTRFVAAGARGATGSAPLDQKTLFEIGSISKTFTTTLLAQMVVAGEVKLDDPVQQFLPAGVTMPSKDGKQITLLDLATSTSGLPRMPNLEPTDAANPYADFDAQKLYAFLNGYTLTRAPGEAYEYSNLGMGLLGHVLALKAGKSYEALVTDRILRPLGMRETWITIPATERGRMAQGHNRELAPVANWDLAVLAGAGGWRSTPDDMARFLQAALKPPATPLGRAMQLATTRQRPTGMKDVSIALGWHIIDRNGQQIVFHNGETGGYHSWLGYNPVTGANAVILASSAHDIDDLGLNLVDSTIPRRDPEPVRPTVAVSEALMSEYTGRYELAPTFAIEVTREGDKLSSRPPISHDSGSSPRPTRAGS